MKVNVTDCESDIQIEIQKCVAAFKDVANAIECGTFSDGTEFSLLEFWKRVPFKDMESYNFIAENTDIGLKIECVDIFITRVNNFTNILLPKEGKVIAEFAKNNKICYSTVTTEKEIRYFCQGERIINENIILNEDDLDNMIMYMKVNELPFLTQVLNLVQEKYINGEIDVLELKRRCEPKYNHKLYKCGEVAFREKIADLIKVSSILEDSSLSEFQKAYESFKIFPSVLDFDKRFILLLLNGKNDPLLADVYNLIEYVSKTLYNYKEKGYEEVSRAIRKLESQLSRIPTYEDSRKIVIDYIESSCVDDISFFNEANITSRDFEKMVNKVKNLAPNLYKQYLEKVNENKILHYNNIVAELKDVANAMESGYFADGTEFSLLEFWARIPLKRNAKVEYNNCCEVDPNLPPSAFNFRSRILTFAKYILSKEQYDIMLAFFNKYNIRTITHLSELDLKDMFNGMKKMEIYGTDENGERKSIINISLCDEDINYMINYIWLKKLPLMSEILNAVQSEYVQGKITREMIDALKEAKQNIKSKTI